MPMNPILLSLLQGRGLTGMMGAGQPQAQQPQQPKGLWGMLQRASTPMPTTAGSATAAEHARPQYPGMGQTMLGNKMGVFDPNKTGMQRIGALMGGK
jgi:hypothetical protein